MTLRQAVRKNGGRRWESGEGSVHTVWKMPISFRANPGAAKGKESTLETGGQQKVLPVSTTYLGVRTCVVKSILSVNPMVLDFGEVTAQQRTILHLTLRNNTPNDPQELRMEPLPENACFTVLNATRVVKGRPFQLAVEFQPQYAQIYSTVLKLTTQKTRVQVVLKGKGVRPILAIDPADGLMHMGAVCYSKDAADYVCRDLKIQNTSPFSLRYSLESLLRSEANHAGIPPFTLHPATGVVQGNSEQNVVVTFRPQRPLETFKERLLVQVPNQKQPTFVYLAGNCFMYQMYAMYDEPLEPFTSLENADAFADSLAINPGVDMSAEPTGGDRAYKSSQRTQFHLLFDPPDAPEVLAEQFRYLQVGATAAPGTKGEVQGSPAGTFTFNILPNDPFDKYFTVEPKTGTLNAGQTTKISFKYAAPVAPDALTLAGMDTTVKDLGSLLSGIGQWIVVQCECILDKGYVPPNAPPTQKFNVELKAYLRQI